VDRGAYPDEEVQLYLSGSGFYELDSASLSIFGDRDLLFGDQVFAADADADLIKEPIIAESTSDLPLACRFLIYKSFASLDTIVDAVLQVDTLNFRSLPFTSACLGDINADGFADFAVSDFGYSPAYVQFHLGSSELDSILDYEITSPWGGINFGYDLVPLGDFNGDNYDDFLMLNRVNPVQIYWGGPTIGASVLTLQYGGTRGALCGDVNDDGWQDIIVGLPEYNSGNGRVCLYYGGLSMDSVADVIFGPFDFHPSPTFLGRSVGPAGDFNSDGVDDFAISGGTSFGPIDRGIVIVVSGEKIPNGVESEEDDTIIPDSPTLNQNFPIPSTTKPRYHIHFRV